MTLKLQMSPRFPARVVGANGIGVARASGVVTIENDPSGVARIVSLPDKTIKDLYVFDSISGSVSRIAISAVFGATIRERLLADRTYYVDLAGNNGNSGLTSLSPLATIQKAYDTIVDTLDLNGFETTIKLLGGAGVIYTAGLSSSKGPVGNDGSAAITLDGGGATIQATNGDCIALGAANGFGGQPVLTTKNVVLQTVGSGSCISIRNGIITINAGTNFGSCAGIHIFAGHTGTQVIVSARTVSGNAQYGIFGYAGAYIVEENGTVTFSAPVTFGCYLAMTAGAIGQFTNASYVNPGNVTGQRHLLADGADITTGGDPASFFPGTIAGTVDGSSSFDGALGTFSSDLTIAKSNPAVKLNANAGSAPQVLFQINGATVSWIEDNGAGILVNSNAGGTHGMFITHGADVWTAISDARLPYKRTARDITDNLPSLDGYRLYESEVEGRLQLFPKAQEIAPLFPHVVVKGDGDPDYVPTGMNDPRAWGLNYDRLGAIALAYLRKQEKEIAELKLRLAVLEN